jgi:tryptophan-rich sensory protein
VFWSLLYFRLHRPDWSLFEVPLLWLSVLALIVVLARFAKGAAWLLVPYLVWVAIAALLNWQTVTLNGPFGAT